MKPETRGRPRQFKNPVTLPLKVEREDKLYWRQCATQSGQSLNQWMIDAADKKALHHKHNHVFNATTYAIHPQNAKADKKADAEKLKH